MRALSTASSALEAQSTNIDRIANDLANVNTDGYKRGRTEFSELMYDTIREPGSSLGSSTVSPVGVQVGMGVKVGASHKIMEQGPTKVTGHDYDVMIQGKGLFPVQAPNGEIFYTRRGSFHKDPQGRIVMSEGAMLLPQMTVPNNATSIGIAPNGEVKVNIQGQVGEQTIGQIQLVSFPNEQGLSAAGTGFFAQTSASGAPIQSVPGENGIGTLEQGALEGSNVNIANSMVEMISTQRAYEMGTKLMGAVDQMMGATTNIK